MTTTDLGRTAYEAYADSVGGLGVWGDVLPDWSDLGDTIREAWQAAADAAVSSSTNGREVEL